MKKTIITLLLTVLISTSASSQEITYSQELVNLANAGYAEAQTALGLCFEQGRGTVKNINLATVWYDKAAYDHNDPNGMINLGRIRLHGPEGLQDYDEAFKLLTKAAKHKSTSNYRQSSALFHLSYCYKDGKGTKKDVKKAIELLLKATIPYNGDYIDDLWKNTATLALGMIYLEKECLDETKAKKYLSDVQQDENGCYYKAQTQLGSIYEKDNNLKLAELHFRNGEPQNAWARYRLASIYYSQEKPEAFQLLQKTTNDKIPGAMVLLSHCYEFGVGTNIDKEKATYWLKEAAKYKDRKAIEFLKTVEYIE